MLPSASSLSLTHEHVCLAIVSKIYQNLFYFSKKLLCKYNINTYINNEF